MSTAAESTFRGYPIDLLIKVQTMGRALIDEALYEASQAYTDPKRGSGTLGPALLASDSSISVTPASVRSPDPVATLSDAPTPGAGDDEEEVSPWDRFSLLEIRNLLKANNVTYPRTMTKGGAIRRATDAGLVPPPE